MKGLFVLFLCYPERLARKHDETNEYWESAKMQIHQPRCSRETTCIVDTHVKQPALGFWEPNHLQPMVWFEAQLYGGDFVSGKKPLKNPTWEQGHHPGGFQTFPAVVFSPTKILILMTKILWWHQLFAMLLSCQDDVLSQNLPAPRQREIARQLGSRLVGAYLIALFGPTWNLEWMRKWAVWTPHWQIS